jgi:hypothetical protein
MADARDDSSALERVVDDLAPRQDAIEWAVDELTRGRSFEETVRELTEGGWPEGEATEIVEQARRLTRHVRGVVTRDDVMRDANRRYRQAMGVGWFAAFPSIAAIRRLVHALGSLALFRRHRRR